MDARLRHAALIVAIGLALGCESGSATSRRPSAPRSRPPAGAHVEELSPDALAAEPPPPAIADTPAPGEPGAPPARAARTVERAPAPDSEYASDEPVPARRYVYSVRLVVPESLGVNRSDLAIPAAELFVDVSAERVRARFVGPGWPVEAGSEVRVRGDSPGAYVFDGRGGRSLAPGALSEWFEGGPRNRTGPPLSVRRDPAHTSQEVPGGLICALIAEWAGESRENLERRCDGRAPLGFRVGFWRAERTADVPVELPRRALRADEANEPAAVPASHSRAFLEPGALARLPAMERPPPSAGDEPAGPAEGLEFVNESEARVVVTVEGVAVGWVDAGTSGLFVGLRPGSYRVAALRPMGAVVIRPRVAVVPGRSVLRASRR
jgi:hypothetical protein